MENRILISCFIMIISFSSAWSQVTLISPDIDIEIGDTVIAPIKINGFEDMTSFQLSVGWDTVSLEFIETGDYFSGALAGSFNQTQLEEGKIGALWFDSSGNGVSVEDSTTLFSIKFVGVGDSQEGATLAFINEPLDIEFTDTSLNPLPDTLLSFEEGSLVVGDVVSIISFVEKPLTLTLYPNIPNPFSSSTNIIFDLYSHENVNLEVYDALGRNIHSINTELLAGRNNFVLPREIFPKAGIYFYKIRAGAYQLSSSVLFLDK